MYATYVYQSFVGVALITDLLIQASMLFSGSQDACEAYAEKVRSWNIGVK